MTFSSLELPSVAATRTEEGIDPLLGLDQRGPIRAELLGLEGLQSQARRLALACLLGPWKRARSPLLERFVANRRGLMRARQEISSRDRDEIHGIDADWLADNFHIIDDVLREVKEDLPSGYDRVLLDNLDRLAREMLSRRYLNVAKAFGSLHPCVQEVGPEHFGVDARRLLRARTFTSERGNHRIILVDYVRDRGPNATGNFSTMCILKRMSAI